MFIVVLFAANNLKLVVRLLLCLQGSMETSEPVSIKNCIPEPLSIIISLLLPGVCFVCCVDDVVVVVAGVEDGNVDDWQLTMLVSKAAILDPFISFPDVDRSVLQCTYMGQHTSLLYF